MKKSGYQSMNNGLNRRDFFRLGGTMGAAALVGIKLGNPDLFAQEKSKTTQMVKPKTNIEDALKIPRTSNSLPGPFPGRVVKICNQNILLAFREPGIK